MKIIRYHDPIDNIVNWMIQDGEKYIPIDRRNMDFVDAKRRIMNGENYDLEEQYREEFLLKLSEG